MTPIPRRLWQIAGVLGIVHVVLIPVGIAIQQSPLFEEGTNGIRESYVEGDLSRTLTGWLVGSFDFLLLIPVLVFLARALGRRTEAGGWAAQTGLMCGIAYVTVIFAVGFPAGAAAMYGAQHGLEVDVAFALNNLRTFGYFLSLMLLAGSTLGIALSAIAEGVHPRWFGGFGIFTAVALLVSTPLSAVGDSGLGHLGLDGVVHRCLRPDAPPPGAGQHRSSRISSHERRRRARLTRGGRGAQIQSVGGVARRWHCCHRRARLGAALGRKPQPLRRPGHRGRDPHLHRCRSRPAGRPPREPGGPVMLAGAVAWGVGEGLLAWGARRPRELTRLGDVRALAVIGTAARGVGWLLLVLVLPVIFPDGRAESRLAARLATGCVLAFAAGSLLAPIPLEERLTDTENPIGVPDSWSVLVDLLAIGAIALVRSRDRARDPLAGAPVAGR